MFAPNAFCIIELGRLKRYLKANKDTLQIKVAAPNSDNPAKGFLIYPQQVNELMTTATYD